MGDWNEHTDVSEQARLLPDKNPKRKGHQLEIVKGPGETKTFTLEGDYLVVGRMEGVDIQLDSSEVSRRHMLLTRRGLEYSFQDLESLNAIYLNGIKVHSAVLKEGDTLKLGDVVLLYHETT